MTPLKPLIIATLTERAEYFEKQAADAKAVGGSGAPLLTQKAVDLRHAVEWVRLASVVVQARQ